MIKKVFTILISLIFCHIILNAQTENATSRQLAGCLLEYPFSDQDPPVQTPAPEGYVPFHIEHYGRHGSRWLINSDDYAVPVKNLEKAEKAGKLTPLGKTTLYELRKIQKASQGRLGELSDKGAMQHKTIGKRMAKNYPEIFNSDAILTAKATIVIRCILSMANALEGIQSIVPDIHFEKDASYADMWFMNFDDKPLWAYKDSIEALLLPSYRDSVVKSTTFLSRLVTDEQFASDSVAPGILPRLYWVLANTQSHSGQPWLLEDVFSREELENNWKAGNAIWFMHGANTPLTEGKMPFTQRNLLSRIIEQTDSAIQSDRPSANLRFGHDGILISLVTLMDINGYGKAIQDFKALEKSDWIDYNIIPMAGNLQLVFYRPEGSNNPDDVLVKAMINETEVTMPGQPVNGPFYRWSDLKTLYKDKISSFTY